MTALPRHLTLWTALLVMCQACAGQGTQSSTLASAATSANAPSASYSGGLQVEDSLVSIDVDGVISVQTINTINDIDTVKTDLTILGVARRSHNGSIQIRPVGGTDIWQKLTLPAPSEQVTIPNFCSRGAINSYEVRVSNNFGRIAKLPSLSLSILSKTDKAVNIGHATLFCFGSNCQKDDIVTLSCADAKIDVQ